MVVRKMIADLNAKTVLFAAPKDDTDFVNLMQREKSTRPVSHTLSNNAANINLSTTRTALLLSPLALAACGGGDENGESNYPSNVGAPEATLQQTYITTTTGVVERLEAAGAQALQRMVVVDFVSGNGFSEDSRIYLYQTSVQVSHTDTGPAVNTLSLIEYDHDNKTLSDVTEVLLDEFRLDGGARKIAVGDLNNDGVDDFAFALSKEDGRLWVNGWDATPQVLLSNIVNKKYDIVSFSNEAYHHSVAIVEHPIYGNILHLDMDGGFWSFDQASPQKISLNWDANWQNPTFFSVDDSLYAVSESDALSGTLILLKMVERDFEIVDSLETLSSGDVVATSFDPFAGPGDVVGVSSSRMVSVDGENIIAMGAWQFENFTNDLGETYVAVQRSGYAVSEPLIELEDESGLSYPVYSVFKNDEHRAIYEIYNIDEDHLVKIDFSMDDQLFSKQNINFFDFYDINGDDVPDFVFYPIKTKFGENVLIYVSDGDFEYRRLQLDEIFADGEHSTLLNRKQRLLLEGENIEDMTLFVANGDNNRFDELNADFNIIF